MTEVIAGVVRILIFTIVFIFITGALLFTMVRVLLALLERTSTSSRQSNSSVDILAIDDLETTSRDRV
jgi:hypothetical protein